MANPFDEPDAAAEHPAASAPGNPALLAQLRAELAQRQAAKAPMYRVVEVTRDARGRLVQQGRIWHSDLDHARRFGRALAGNSVSQKVVVADQTGAVLEQLPVPPPGSAPPSGWMGWRDMPLPPAPPRARRPQPPLFRPSVADAPVLVAPASAFGLFDDDPVARPLPAKGLPPPNDPATRFPPTLLHPSAAPWPDVFAQAEADANANAQDAVAEPLAVPLPLPLPLAVQAPGAADAAADAVAPNLAAAPAPPAPAAPEPPTPTPPPASAGASRLRARLTGQTLT